MFFFALISLCGFRTRKMKTKIIQQKIKIPVWLQESIKQITRTNRKIVWSSAPSANYYESN
ncbi:hypothetical protein BpHYR1_030421 [Brachionus plicatilis]|uniref:Uncharacterized protein n=1 Tax=Brachionus plicatilis TaxID=10195 RepID=A0A3M7SLL7_BRAPC|nr:hypothetical protein BpHYR1_030421 [Brachionus plicatilis]